MVRITDDSASSSTYPVHRTHQKKARNYTSSPVISVKTTVTKEESSDKDEIPPLLRSTPPKIDIINDWRHPAELDYLDVVDLSKADVIKFLITHSFSVPGRPPHRSRWTTITLGNGTTTVIPTPYRIPLMFAANFQWTSLQLVLSVDTKIRKKEWDEVKGGILHVSRLCDALLSTAQRAMGVGMKRTWRCKTFDRALVRYRMGWLLSDPWKVQEFWNLYGKEEYEKDPVKLDWKRWVLKGHKGFKLNKEQIEGGITLNHWLDGLKEHQGDWVWDMAHVFPLCPSALQYLEHWNKTGIWDQESEALTSASFPYADQPSNMMNVDPVSSGMSISVSPSYITLETQSRDTEMISPDRKHIPISVEFLEILSHLKAQEQRISLLEVEIRNLKRGQVNVAFPQTLSPTPTAFVPASNFPNIRDDDCTESFWNHPLGRFLDPSCLEDLEPVVIAGSRAEEATDERSLSGPIKSLRKLQKTSS
ncbi:hypothetical protein DFS33DRAFT_222796 [Desarmillaria ectypa]|nr:hypothetical protein DFS33DRAFT_222796 [Desarmillaria ectypa]